MLPPDVIGVQMGEDDRVHQFAGKTGRTQPLEIVGVQVVPGGIGAVLAVTDARVHEDSPAVRLDGEGLSHERWSVLTGEIRPQPGCFVHDLAGGVR
jgi:hypothetical protein